MPLFLTLNHNIFCAGETAASPVETNFIFYFIAGISIV
jgi:hypothetical protein